MEGKRNDTATADNHPLWFEAEKAIKRGCSKVIIRNAVKSICILIEGKHWYVFGVRRSKVSLSKYMHAGSGYRQKSRVISLDSNAKGKSHDKRSTSVFRKH